jgi:type II secretory pathway component GspD/PulD (secretin)
VKQILIVALLALLAPAAAAQARVTPSGQGVTIDIVDTDLRAAVQALAQHLDRPVVFGPVAGMRVTLQAPRAVPPSDVPGLLRGLLEANGHELVEAGGMYRVQQKAAAQPSGPAPMAMPVAAPGRSAAPSGDIQLFVIQLRHARASDVAATVNALYGRGGALGELGDRRAGTLNEGLRDNRMAAGQYGVPAGSPTTAQSGARAASLSGELVMVPDARTNSLLVRATPGDFQLIQDAVQKVDVRPLQVLIEVVIAEVRRSTSFDLGLASFLDTTAVRGHPGTSVFGSTQGLGGLGDFALRVMHVGGADLNLTLSAASARGDVTVVSRPVVLTANNEAAQVLVGDQRPFVQLQRTLPTDNGVRDQVVQYKDVGTQLDVRPTISADGYVMLEVTQQVNDASDAESGVAGAPVITTRSVGTHLLVKDGQTAVLGGLVGRQRTRSRGGVPVLSRLPLIGWVFGRTHRTTAETELFIFLTPRVLRDDAAMDSVATQVRRSAPSVGKATRGLRPFAAPDSAKRRRAPTPPPPATPAAAQAAAPPREGP